ncbi:MAG: DUF2868 domain-containing protein [Deltaproteobacteria bacterium]|nr:DUF2868 domain-containing protein [Deltaproteobacteria bacterium]
MATDTSKRARRLQLADLIDLELALLRDRERPLEELLPRDAAIREQIGADQLEGRALYLAWLEARPERARPSTGQRALRLVEMLGAFLAIAGLALGASAVVGWLVIDTGLPVNVVNFWLVMAGAQAFLALLWLAAVLPGLRLRAIPLLGGVVALLQDLARAVPAAAGWLLTHLPGSSRGALLEELGQLRCLDWLYGGLRFWLLVRASQVFAFAFNAGAALAFVLIPYVDDPAFGWRSRLLDAEELYEVVEIASLPWSPVFPEASVDFDEVRATQYSSVQRRLERIGRQPLGEGEDPWAAWWPFLLVSLLCYGLAPRAVFLTVAAARVRGELARASLDHAEFQRLRDRLKRPHVETRAPGADPDGPRPEGAGQGEEGLLDLGPGPIEALTWCGVGLDEAELAEAFEARFGMRPSLVREVGGIDAAADHVALDALATSGGKVAAALIVEAWEPPVADYVDFVRELRTALGRGRPLVVALCNRGEDGALLPAEPRQATQWRRRLAELGDPWLRVESLAAEASA